MDGKYLGAKLHTVHNHLRIACWICSPDFFMRNSSFPILQHETGLEVSTILTNGAKLIPEKGLLQRNTSIYKKYFWLAAGFHFLQ